MVTICTASLTFNNSTFWPHSVFMYFVWISEQTAIISLYNINWLVFITETELVQRAVRTESLNACQINRDRVTFVVEKVPVGQVFSPSISVFPCCPSTKTPYLYPHTAPTKGTNSRSLSIFPKATFLRKSVSIGHEATCPVPGCW